MGKKRGEEEKYIDRKERRRVLLGGGRRWKSKVEGGGRSVRGLVGYEGSKSSRLFPYANVCFPNSCLHLIYLYDDRIIIHTHIHKHTYTCANTHVHTTTHSLAG